MVEGTSLSGTPRVPEGKVFQSPIVNVESSALILAKTAGED